MKNEYLKFNPEIKKSKSHGLTQIGMEKDVMLIKDFAIESSINAIAFADLQGRLIYVNPSFLEMWGYSSEREVIGKSSLQFWQSPKIARDVVYSLKKNGEWIGELTAKRRDNSLFEVHLAANMVIDDGNQPVCMMATFVDHTELKKCQNKVRRSEEKFRSLVETTSDWIWEVDRKGVYTYVSPKIKELLGYEPQEVLGKTPFTLMPPDEAVRISKLFQNYLRNREPFKNLVNINLHKLGHHVILETSGIPLFGDDGQFKGYRGIDRDITERTFTKNTLELTREKFKKIFDNANDAIYLWELNQDGSPGKCIEVNEVACNILGYTKEEFQKMTPFDINDSESILKMSKIMRCMPREGSYKFEMINIAKDGRNIPVEVSCRIFSLEDRKVILAISRDITERKIFERKIRDSNEQLRRLTAHLQFIREEERAMIAREVHDELGQVLTALKMELSLLGNRIPAADDLALRISISKELKDLGSLVDSTIRTVRKIVEELKPEILESGSITEAIEWYIKQYRKRTGIKIIYKNNLGELSLAGKQTCAVFRIFQESLTNISRHSQAGQVIINLNRDSHNFIMTIRDNGRGITQKKILSNKSIGLIGMRERALFMGGHLEIKGKPGKGTVVTLILPFKHEVQDVSPVIETFNLY